MEWQNTEQRNTEQQIQNGKTRNNKSRIVKGGTSLVRYIAGYLDLNFNIFQCKSNRILVFTSVEGFSNILDKNYIFQTTRFNHTMIFFKLTD